MLCPINYNVLRSDRDEGSGGGVALLYKSCFQISLVEPPNEFSIGMNFEFLCIDLFIERVKYRFLCIYLRPLYSKCATTVQVLCNMIDYFSNVPYAFILLGDFNLPHIDWVSNFSHGNKAHDVFVNFCANNCFYQSVIEPTHIHGNILDLVLCNIKAKHCITSTTVYPPLFNSDHFIVSGKLQLEKSINKSKTLWVFDYENCDYLKANEFLCTIDWNSLLNSSKNIQDFYDSFLSVLNCAIENTT